MSLSADSSVGPSNYEYLFLARSGARSHIDLEQLQKRRDQLRHVTRSMDQYVEMKSRLVGPEEKRESNVEPVAITSIYENRPVKMLNPRRKLRRHAYETFEVADNGSCADKSPCSDGDAVIQEQTFVSNAFLTLKSSQESLLDEKREIMDGQVVLETREATDKRLKRVQMMLPTSPTHYVQPPTPDHPPPSAMQAEKSIHERIRPLSQVKCQFCFPVLSRSYYSARLTRRCTSVDADGGRANDGSSTADARDNVSLRASEVTQLSRLRVVIALSGSARFLFSAFKISIFFFLSLFWKRRTRSPGLLQEIANYERFLSN